MQLHSVEIKRSNKLYKARGGHSGTKWLPTAKRPRRAEAVNAKIKGRSTPLKAKKGGGQLQTKNQIRVVACIMCLFSLYIVNYMMFITLHALGNDWSPFCLQFCIEKV